ncbi:MAG: hypothetical protein DWQ02_23520 [Bacteroidetes bacterium]|nr:MAG: hypothetical protein DWQ02_23520 [Bacteroidota bacterium]
MKFLKIVIVLLFIGGAIGFYLFNKPHKNMNKAKADIKIEAPELFSAFESDELAANEKYLDKVVEVTGVVSEVKQEDGIISVVLETEDLMFGVICQLDEYSESRKSDFKIGESVTLKGLCTGSLMDVVLVRCVEV